MYVNAISIIQVSPCHAEKTKFKAVTMADKDLTEILPYLNAVLDNPNFQESTQSIVFKEGTKGVTIRGNEINITRYANSTELRELLDYLQDLLNDTYDSKEDITPNYKSRTLVPVFKIQGLLPKTNCMKCGEKSCMAFAAQLSKYESTIPDCPVLDEEKYKENKEKLIDLMS